MRSSCVIQEIKKHLSFILAVFSFSPSILAQMSVNQQELKFDQILSLKRELYKVQGLDAQKSQKKLDKFTFYWRDRLNQNGTLGKMTAVFPKQSGAKNNKSGIGLCQSDPAQWTLVGPHTYQGNPTNDWQAGINHTQWDGLMEEVYVPGDFSYTLSSSARGGIWKRVSGSSSWTNVTDALNIPIYKVSSIVASPTDDDHLFASCGGENYGQGIITSLDGGDSWSVLSGFTTAYCAAFPSKCGNGNDQYIDVRKLVVDRNSTGPNNIILVAMTKNTVWKSANSGTTWTNISPPLPSPSGNFRLTDIVIGDFGRMYCSARKEYAADAKLFLYDLLNGWVDATGSILHPTDDIIRMKVSTPDGSTVFVIRDLITGGRDIMKSTNAGSNWTHLGTIPKLSGWGGEGEKSEIEYVASINQVLIGGIRLIKMDATTGNYTSIPQGHVDVRDIFIAKDGGTTYIYTANDGGISKVDYTNNTYENLNGSSLPVLEFFNVGTTQTSEERYLGGVAHNHVYVYDNKSWRKVLQGDGSAGIINPVNHDFGYVTFGDGGNNGGLREYRFLGGSIKTVDGTGNGSSPSAPGGNFGHNLFYDPADSDNLYFSKGEEGVSASTVLNLFDRSARTWTRFNVDHLSSMGEMAISKSSPNVIYVADAFVGQDHTHLGKLVKSTSSGQNGTWTSIGAGNVYNSSGTTVLTQFNLVLAYRRVTDIVIDPNDSDKLWVSISGFETQDESGRVLMSMDGGVSWREHSQGLPRYPVNALVGDETTGILFAGTEAGVYYRTPAMSQWECFNHGMPNAVIMDLDVNRCTRELVAATHGRGIWKTQIQGTLLATDFSSSGTVPFGQTLSFDQDVIIRTNTTLTVSGTIEMAHGMKIVVEPGARLVIDGGKITNACDKFWQGIYVGGSPLQPQLDDSHILDPNQGTVVLKNNAIIEHAIEGVSTASGPQNGNYGGRIFAENSTFLDNRFDVIFYSYSSPNVSYIRNCTFETSAPLKDPSYVDSYGRGLAANAHLKMWDVEDVELTNNVFRNTGTFDQDIKGVGIDVFDATFIVDACQFTDLSQGIRYTSASGSDQMKVKNCIFEKVVQGITAVGGANIIIDNNVFQNYQGSTTQGGIDFMQSWGVYLDASFGSTVANNTFNTSLNGIPDKDLHVRGVIAVNTGIYPTLIENNIFQQGSMIGFLGWYDNSGLQLKCNDFHSDYGIYIDRITQGVQLPSYLPTQGSDTDPTGNKFFLGCSGNERHIFFDGINPLMPNNPPAMFFETILEHYNYSGASLTPICISQQFTNLPYADPGNPPPGFVDNFAGQPYGSQHCQPISYAKLRAGMSLQEVKVRINQLEEELSYLSGSSDQLLQRLIDSNWINLNGYDEIIPGSKVSEYSSLSRKLFVFSEASRQDLMIAYLNDEVDFEFLINKVRNDEDLLIQLIPLAIDKKAEEAKKLIDLLANANGRENYVQFYGILHQLELSGKNHLGLNAQDLKLLEQLANKTSAAGSRAKALLAFIKQREYVPFTDPLDDSISRQSASLSVEKSAFQVYPNPTTGQLNILIESDKLENQTIEIYNVLGKQVQKLIADHRIEIDVSDWKPGVYIIRLNVNDKIQTLRFVNK